MALTFTNVEKMPDGSKYRVTATLAITDGGGTVTAAALGLDQISTFEAQPTGGYVFQYVPSTAALTALYGDYSEATDGVLIADSSAAVSSIPVVVTGY